MFFFFKQKTAYDMLRSLVGSEMCIRDRPKTASISPDVNDPGARNITFEQLRQSYYEQTEALIEGGSDVILVETIFDTLNAKACLLYTSPSPRDS